MNKKLLLAFTCALLAFSYADPATAQSPYLQKMIEKKRAEAAKRKAQTEQMIQHRQSNPEAFLQKEGPELFRGGGEKKISFSQSRNGHFMVPAQVEGRSIQFLADTGASSIFISQNDARKIGINTSSLNYKHRYQTANGAIGRSARTTVKYFNVGPIKLKNVPVTISQEKSHMALLGMDFFNRVSKYGVEDGKLTIYK